MPGLVATVMETDRGRQHDRDRGDDVIVAPIGSTGKVLGLGGSDTICLVAGTSPTILDQPVQVEAGAGDDSVVNETTTARDIYIRLGTGADHFIGADYREVVCGSESCDETLPDTDNDVFETRGGDDVVGEGRTRRVWEAKTSSPRVQATTRST